MIRNAILFLVLAGSLSSCASTPSSSTQGTAIAPVILREGYVYYAVRNGETLWRIARRHNIDLNELIRLNNITDGRRIKAGLQLIVPEAEGMPPKTNFSSSREDLDFFWPVKGEVIAYFRQKKDGVANKGIDIQAPPGTKICAARSGRVTFIGSLPGYGKTIVLDHGDGFSSIYCGARDIAVKTEETVARGLVLARAGARSRSSKGRVHFEIRRKHKPQNPLFFLD